MKYLPTFVNELFTSESSKIDREIDILTEERGFEIVNIYDLGHNGLFGAISLNGVKSPFLFEGRFTLEAVESTLDDPGGVILFSADRNSILWNAYTIGVKAKFFFDSKWKAFLNSINGSGRLRKKLLDNYELPDYTVGTHFRGSYTRKKIGLHFNKNSFTIDIAGVDSNTLLLISTEICREFKQEWIMVRDFNKGVRPSLYFVNDKEISDKI